MFQQYGTALTWSTVGAPHPFGGIAEDYSYNDAFQETPVDGESEIAALVHHARKGVIAFNATTTDASVNFLDLSVGVKLTLSNITAGIILATQAVEAWTLGQPKKLSLNANHYPDMTDTAGTAAGTLSAVTPAAPTGSGIIIRPAGKVIFSTAGLSHESGIIQALTITQQVKLADQEDELGKLIAAFISNYMRTIDLDLVTTGTRPLPDTVLVIAGAPDNAANYVISSSEEAYRKGDKKTYKVKATWIPALATTE